MVALLHAFLLFPHHVKADGEDDLLRGINAYRATLSLPALTENDNAECFADEIADQFKKQPCTNSTGANTVPGTEIQFSNYPDLLKKCHLNITNTKDGVVMPACVPNLNPALVLSNFTQSQYSGSLNDTKYSGVGVGTEGDWVVVVLSTNTPEGSFVPAANSDGDGNTAVLPKVSVTCLLLSLLLGLFLVCFN